LGDRSLNVEVELHIPAEDDFVDGISAEDVAVGVG